MAVFTTTEIKPGFVAQQNECGVSFHYHAPQEGTSSKHLLWLFEMCPEDFKTQSFCIDANAAVLR
jgi:hypothetical protein